MALVMTKEWIRQQCRKYRQFQTPALNDKLYLQNQGFSEIQNLEEYTVSFHSLNVTYSMRAFRSLNVTHSLEVSVRLWSIEVTTPGDLQSRGVFKSPSSKHYT